MVKEAIRIYVRLKPTKKSKIAQYVVEEDQNGEKLLMYMPRDAIDGPVNNRRETFTFRFSKIFDQAATQEDLFEVVAKPIINNVLAGYNGTLFAYGQTGSGKTFTITGGAERYADRGIIPRTLEYIFQHVEKHPESEFTVCISYLEIYNENGYDLLDPKHEAAKLEELPKVTMFEDAEGNIHIRNLTSHQAANEEEALNLLFVGDTNRMIAETPMNQASSRSHCMFTVHVTSKESGAETVRRSKLHLVDLAGSERVAKTGINGTLLTEAKHINLSLHFLEQVIVALGERNRQHIPYRNSMMTSVLRDSLGGNCLTSMVATCSIELANAPESLSTCKFAQRVALVSNEAVVNEELEPALVIARLRREVEALRAQVAMLSNAHDGGSGEELFSNADASASRLTSDEVLRCERAVLEYVDERDDEQLIRQTGIAFAYPGFDMRKIQQCFRALKQRLLAARAPAAATATAAALESDSSARSQAQSSSNSYNNSSNSLPAQQISISLENPVYANREMRDLRDIIQQRDNEITVLVSMLKREKKRANAAAAKLSEVGVELEFDPRSDEAEAFAATNSSSRGASSFANAAATSSSRPPIGNGRPPTGQSSKGRPPLKTPSVAAASAADDPTLNDSAAGAANPFAKNKPQSDPANQAAKKAFKSLSVGKQEAFDIFKRDNPRARQELDGVERNRLLLRTRYTDAKQLATELEAARSRIAKLKGELERQRVAEVMSGEAIPATSKSSSSLSGRVSAAAGSSSEAYEALRAQLENAKQEYRGAFERLKTLKPEIEHLQHLVERSKLALIKEFEEWWQAQVELQQQQQLQQEAGESDSRPSTHASTLSTTSASATDSAGAPLPPIGSAASFQRGGGGAASSSSLKTRSSSDTALASERSGRSSARHVITESASASTSGASEVPLTGDPEADADILAFMRARQRVSASAKRTDSKH